MFIEAEDADYGAAQFVPAVQIGMSGPYAGGSYAGLGDGNDLDVDWHATGPNGQTYRDQTALSAGKERGSAGSDRGYFQVTDWWTLGWNNGGDWENYTRVFPANPQWYEVYGHLASGGGNVNLRLSKVTSGAGTTTQTLQTLGAFAPGRPTAGWDSLEIFPLLNGPGGSQTVVNNLGGTTTLRITHDGAEDVDYFAFVPVSLPVATITINQQPQNVTVPQGTTALFTVGATTTGQYGILYQWSKNGVAIPGANSSSYRTPPLDLPNNGDQYSVTLRTPSALDYATVTSQTAVVTVVVDTTPPQVVSVGSLQNQLAGSEIGVIFNKPLNGTSAATLGNYSLDNGATVTAAYWVTNSSGFTAIFPDLSRVPDREQGVVLSVSALNPATAYHLTVQNVQDYLGNTMGSVTLPAVQSPYTWVSLGVTGTNDANPNGIENNALAVGSNSWNLVNGGNAFWGTEDDITFIYQPITGDFDKTEQVEWNDPSSNWARTGILAREDVNPANAIGLTVPRYQSVISDPETKFDGTSANDQFETNRRINDGDGTTSSNGGGNPSYPNSFVRLKRVGQMVMMFHSSSPNRVGPWMPLGTTDFDPIDNPASLTPLTNVLYVGPMLGVENGNIACPNGQGCAAGFTNGAYASRIRNYGDMVNKARGTETYSVGLNFAADEAGGALSASDIAGVDAVAQGNWNNLIGNAPAVTSGITADNNGLPVPTVITVTATGSGNTWASQGPRGEEAAANMTGNDAILMTGYLDTGAPSTTDVALTGIPSNLTSGGYDVIVYAQGGVGARGGGYRILDSVGGTLRDYIKAQGPTAPTGFIPVVPDPVNWATGNFMVFTNLTANSITVEATTDNSQGFGGTPRAPINAIQLVHPAGLIVVVPPTISIAKNNGVVTITFTGVLRYSATVNGTYTPVSNATSPYTATIPGFYRASSQ
jgi:hypothetical protein